MFHDCPYYHHTNNVLAHTFIKVSDQKTKILIDLSVSEKALENTYDEIDTLLNHIS